MRGGLNDNIIGERAGIDADVLVMSRLRELIAELCSDGVEYVPLGTVCDITKGEQINKINVCKRGTYPVINGGTEAA